jgi:hypothetical protein
MSSAAVANPLVVGVAAAAGADRLEDDGDENVGFAASPMEAKISSCFGFDGWCGLVLIIGVFRNVVAPKEEIVAVGMAGVGADTGAETTRDEDVGALSSSQSSQSMK